MKPIELRCSRDLALLLGAIEPESMQHYSYLFRQARMNILVRDRAGNPLFWPVVPSS